MRNGEMLLAIYKVLKRLLAMTQVDGQTPIIF